MGASLRADAITCGSPTTTSTAKGCFGPWKLAIDFMVRPPIGSKNGKPEPEAAARAVGLPACVNPVRVTGPKTFNLLALWT
ncbi:hypothetical protein QTI17_22800 [Variovorax sp. J31P179]|jgi:hypothetical protein|uniref:hypothetical protein n=1 Tax=Variovorax sp. J31P179 TaxID=3053508 RepID=UPI002574B230|nr:hypothetical protein [Variovorax sp. J31P179]MDM0083430.1 hypothetical protein [Variovorax sp. J31P179]